MSCGKMAHSPEPWHQGARPGDYGNNEIHISANNTPRTRRRARKFSEYLRAEVSVVPQNAGRGVRNSAVDSLGRGQN